MRYSQLFWDFDGTLVDTYPGMVAAFGEALVASGVNDFEIDQDAIYQTMRQHSLGTALQRFSAEYQLDVSRLKRLYQLRAEPRLADAPVFDGAAEILAATVAAGGRNFLLTHRNHRAMDRLATADLAQYFSGQVTADDDYPRKPNPTSLLALCQQYAVKRQSALMIGDRNLDVQAGHRAGMAGALFDPEHLIVDESHPEIRVIRLAELLAWLQA